MSSLFLSIISGVVLAAIPGFQPSSVQVATDRKNALYQDRGLIVGGDQAVDRVVILDIRHAKKPEFERVVLDLEGTLQGESSALDRAPYFQVEVSPEQSRMVMTLLGSPRLALDPGRLDALQKEFKKSAIFSGIEVYPVLEKDRWRVQFNLKRKASLEVFELSNPARIVLDIKPGR